MKVTIPEELKKDIPQTTWGKILSATPIVMTVIATLLAGLASSEMTRAQYDRAFGLFGKARVNHKVARFRQVNMNEPNVHHDALEFPDGLIVKVTRLVEGQTATVLQLPASVQHQDRKSTSQMSAGTIDA